MYHVPLTLQCICGRSEGGGENRDGKEGNEIPGGEGRVEII